MPRRMVGGEGNSVPQSNGGNFNQHNASQSAAGLPSTSTTTATGTYHLFSAGSNSGGQLGTGSQEDSHIWSPALYRPAGSSSDAENEKQEALAFPPAGSRVLQLAGGANHTLALVLDESSGKRSVWRSGDGERGQWGAPEPEGGTGEEKEGRRTATLFTPLPVPAGLIESNLKPRLVAASWENSYIVYSPHSSGSDQERGDDVLVVLGRENDFGQIGLGKTEGKAAPGAAAAATAPGVGVISLSGAVPDDEDGASARERGRGRLEIVHLVGSVRHVVLLASWLTSCGSNTHGRRYALIGWGAGRQGQLGSLDAQSTTQGRSTGSGAPAGAGAGNIIWTPRLIRLWSSEQLDIDTQASLSLGRDHTALLVPSHWRSESSRNEEEEDQGESRLLLLGSNKYGQLAISASIGPGAQSEVRNAISIACTWNSTLLFLADGSLLASGRNDKGQLGGETEQKQQRSPALAQLVRVPAVDAGSHGGARALKQALVCGSEHALLLVQSSSSSSSSLLQGSPSTEVGRQSSVWGWGWNEHGNLALGGRRFPSEGQGKEEEAVEDQRTPVRIWPAPAALEAAGDSAPAVHEVATHVWAGCATSFVQVLRTGTQR
ncbi:RCC1/BLIP-II [Microstroma glucosiphilum]|uniref:RCC1/BLIP-II n=1 Tax=Pseudomicrostroma glucosiphilum TaxID=1684307 RepID=A0A316UFI9_9BASI|nr:RCC1/BLIP-II [Pseudomicrostroma glucosiphilum]PWN23694.1 RCC1/BLIP-II [Pseudomicrostroma glucosiphilum]